MKQDFRFELKMLILCLLVLPFASGCCCVFKKGMIPDFELATPGPDEQKLSISIDEVALGHTQHEVVGWEARWGDVQEIFSDSGLFSEVLIKGEGCDLSISINEEWSTEMNPPTVAIFTGFLIPFEICESAFVVNAEVTNRAGKTLRTYRIEDRTSTWMWIVFLPCLVWESILVTSSVVNDLYTYLLFRMQQDGLLEGAGLASSRE